MIKLSNNQKNKIVGGAGLGATFSAMSPYLKTFFISSASNIGIGVLSNILNITSSAIYASKNKSSNLSNYNKKEYVPIKNSEFKSPILNLI